MAVQFENRPVTYYINYYNPEDKTDFSRRPSENYIRSYFSKYGNISDITMPDERSYFYLTFDSLTTDVPIDRAVVTRANIVKDIPADNKFYINYYTTPKQYVPQRRFNNNRGRGGQNNNIRRSYNSNRDNNVVQTQRPASRSRHYNDADGNGSQRQNTGPRFNNSERNNNDRPSNNRGRGRGRGNGRRY